MRGHCCMPQPCTLTLFSCTLLFSSVGHFLGHVLESNFGRRPKPSGTALRRSPFVMELLLRRPALSQKCPLLVPACGHRTAMQQDYNQAARAIRPYTKPKGSERECGSEKRRALEDQVLPGSAAMLGHSSSPPLHTAIVRAPPKRSWRKDVRKEKAAAGPFILFKHTDSTAPYLHRHLVRKEKLRDN